MADEKKPIDSVPPPTDEVDSEWSKEEPAEAAKAAPGVAPARLVAKPSREDDEDEDEDDEDEDEDEDDEDEDDEDEDDEDEDDEDEDDEDEDDEEASATSSERRASSEDWLPDWAPWATLGGLISIGLLGGLGLLPIDLKLEKAPAPAASATAAATATSTTTAAAAASAKRKLPSSMASSLVDQGPAISAAHVLIAYQGAMRANPKITRTKEEAKKLAEQVDKKAKAGADFKKLAGEYSDEPRAAERGGELGSFTRNRMVKPFADAAFELKVGEVSNVVETQFGFHVIKRTK